MAADVQITSDALATLIATQVREELAKIMTQRSPDEAIQEALDRARGKDRPLPPEYLIQCKSPLTGSTFTARLQASRRHPGGRVIELLDYVRPEGWDRHKRDGGLVNDDTVMWSQFQPGKPDPQYANWVRKTFWQRDAEALIGHPLAPQWRADSTPPAGSVVLTPEQLAKLGITAEQIQTAVADDDEIPE